MKVIKRKYDKCYPYTVKDSWGDEIYITLDDLKELKKEIEKILKENEKNS